MKKYVLSIVLLAISQMGIAQMVLENEAAVVYYMPKNELSITVEYDVIEEEPGVFYQYARRYLGTEDVITENKTTCELTAIKTDLLSMADTERAYKIVATQGSKEQVLSLTEDGRLLGFNIAKPACKTEKIDPSVLESESSSAVLMPLLEEHFMAGSISKMAEGAAKQIYRIRETRINMLAGEVEHVPADGKAMQLVLEELAKQEQILTELFVGKTTVTHKSEKVVYHPEESIDDELLCRFSTHTGVVDADDLSGEPIYINVVAHKQAQGMNMVLDKKAPALSQVYYNLPGHAQVSIEYKNKQMACATYQIAQFGVAIPLAKQLFTGKPLPSIYFDAKTGNILSIQQ